MEEKDIKDLVKKLVLEDLKWVSLPIDEAPEFERLSEGGNLRSSGSSLSTTFTWEGAGVWGPEWVEILYFFGELNAVFIKGKKIPNESIAKVSESFYAYEDIYFCNKYCIDLSEAGNVDNYKDRLRAVITNPSDLAIHLTDSQKGIRKLAETIRDL